MTDDISRLDRRRQDPKLDEILQGQKDHIAEYHAFNKEQLLVMVEQHDINTETIEVLVEGQKQDTIAHDRLILVLEGVPDYDASGHIIGHIGGMRNDITDMKIQGNGGGGFSLRARDKAQIVGVMTGILVVLERIAHLYL